MPGSGRKWMARLFQLVLVLIAVAFVTHWMGLWNGARHVRGLHVTSVSGMPDSLGPGDMRIYDADSSVDLVLVGDQLAEGLSPKTVAKVRRDLDSAKSRDSGTSSGFERLIRNSVAGAIDTHVKYSLADMRDLRFENGKFVVYWKTGGHEPLFDKVNVNDQRGATFREADAQRFIAAVQARLKEMNTAPPPPTPPAHPDTGKAAAGH